MIKKLCLLLITPFGLLISLNALIRGWENGNFWWATWLDIWFDRPDSVCYTWEEE
jgi:hypothetical protein